MKIVMFCFNNLILIAIRRRSAHCHCYQSQSCVPELPGLAPVCWLKISILIFSLRCEVSVSCVFETLAFQTKSYHWSVICTPPALECNVCAVLCTMIGYPPPLPCLWLVTGHGCTPAHWRQLAPSVRTEIDTIEQRRLGRRRGDDTISQSEARDAPRDPIRGRQMCPDIPGNANVGDKGSGAVTTSKIWCQASVANDRDNKHIKIMTICNIRVVISESKSDHHQTFKIKWLISNEISSQMGVSAGWLMLTCSPLICFIPELPVSEFRCYLLVISGLWCSWITNIAHCY